MNLFTRYGIMASGGGKKYIIKDGVLQSGYEIVKNVDSTVYGISGTYPTFMYIKSTLAGSNGIRINANFTNKSTLKINAFHYVGNTSYYGKIGWALDGQFFSGTLEEVKTTTATDYELDISSLSGMHEIILMVYGSSTSSTNQLYVSNAILK